MGTQVRGQEFGFASQRAAAQDAINRFNAQQQAEANLYNIQAGDRDFRNQILKQQLVQGAIGPVVQMQTKDAEAKKKMIEDANAGLMELGKAGASAF